MSAIHSPRSLTLAACALFVIAMFAMPAGAQLTGKTHPRLASAKTSCTICHSALTAGKKVIHAATEDCAGCHTVASADGATTVALTGVDPALCLTCHDGLAAAVEGTLAAPHPVVADGCLTCHVPHAGDEPKLLVARQSELCGNCHDAAALAPKHGELLTPATSCTGCHLPHGGPVAKLLTGKVQHSPFQEATCNACHRPNFGERIRLQARGQRLCLACHDDPAKLTGRQSVHGALADDAKGRAGCLSCHQPHLSQAKALAVAPGVALCANCHAPVVAAAKAKTGHAAAVDNCANCHLPHAGPQPKLLKSAPRELCAECHDTNDAALAKKHLGADLAQLACLTCHSPHGAGQPKLLSASVHPPVLDGCDNCHEGTSNKLLEGGGQALCVTCHSGIPEAAAKAVVPHPAMEMDACTTCHAPHASERAKLVKSPAQACGDCHAEQLAGPGETAHGVIAGMGCQTCHEPHGGANAKLLRRTGAELCLSCHSEGVVRAGAGGDLTVLDGRKVPASLAAKMPALVLSADGMHDHPTIGHRVLGRASAEELARTTTSFRDELTCLTCHDPHKGKSAGLLRWGAASATEACNHCHEK